MEPNAEVVVNVTRQILLAQPTVPASPADSDGNLCFAGAVAKAGFVARGQRDAAERLHCELTTTQSKSRLYEAFRELGWSATACTHRLVFNDSLPSVIRKATVLEHLLSFE